MEDLAQLKAAVETKKWWKNTMRTSIKPKTESHYARGWRHLKEGVYSNTVREGPILQLVQKILGDEITDVCCNRNVTCHPHRDKANTSAHSFFLMWGDFEGGALNVDELGKIRRITEKTSGTPLMGKGIYIGTTRTLGISFPSSPLHDAPQTMPVLK